MSKKESNPLPLAAAIKPPPPPAPPPKRIIKEDVDFSKLFKWREGKPKNWVDQEAKCYGILKGNSEKICLNCKHGEHDDKYPDTIPSIYKCHNEKSGRKSPAWCSTCDYFESKERSMT